MRDEKDFIMLTAMAGEGVFDAKVPGRGETPGKWWQLVSTVTVLKASAIGERSIQHFG